MVAVRVPCAILCAVRREAVSCPPHVCVHLHLMAAHTPSADESLDMCGGVTVEPFFLDCLHSSPLMAGHAATTAKAAHVTIHITHRYW